MNADATASTSLDALLRDLLSNSLTVPIAKGGGAGERIRLVSALERGERPIPNATEVVATPFHAALRDELAKARAHAASDPLGALYLARLDEIELDYLIREARNDIKRLRPLLARRYGNGRETVAFGPASASLFEIAKHVLEHVKPSPEEAILPPDDAFGGPSFAAIIRSVALHAGIELHGVVVEADLIANAITTPNGEIRISSRDVGPREALRCAVHEVMGHVVSTLNANAQSRRIFSAGTAEAFADQEGLALTLEEHAGLLDASRLRTLATRVLATSFFHDGQRFEEVAMRLFREHNVAAEEAIAVTSRTFRGGGSAREACYLRGFLRVREAISRGDTSIDELRNGKLSLASLAAVRQGVTQGLVRPPPFKPTLKRALGFVDRSAFAKTFNVDDVLSDFATQAAR